MVLGGWACLMSEVPQQSVWCGVWGCVLRVTCSGFQERFKVEAPHHDAFSWFLHNIYFSKAQLGHSVHLAFKITPFLHEIV